MSLRLTLVAPLFPPLHSGAGRQARSVLERLGDAVRTEVVTLGGAGLPEEEHYEGYVLHRLASVETTRPARRFGRAAVARLFRAPVPDLLWILGVGPATYGALAVARLRKIPTVVKLTLEGEDDPKTLAEKPGGRLRLKGLAAADALVCPTGRMAALAVGAGLGGDRLRVIPNGVDIDRFAPTSEPVSPHSLIYLGSIEPRKKIDLLLDVVERLAPHHPDLRLRLVGSLGRAAAVEGDRTYVRDLEARGRDGVLAGRVLFEGPSAEPERVLGESGMFLLASKAEGLPNALLEAMASGLAPVVSALPALTGVIESGRNGLLVEEPTAEAWTRAVGSLLDHPERARALGRAARETVVKRFDLDTVAAAYGALFEHLAGKG